MQIIGVGHEREEKAEIVRPNFEQTDGSPFVIGAENKRKLSNMYNLFLQGVTSVTSFYCLYKAI